MKDAFAKLRDHARERGISFTITFEEFCKFAKQSHYIESTGLGPMCITVDRKDNLRGYEPGNIQPLTRSANSIKRGKQDMMRSRHGFKWASPF
jgi:hypothetical protein